MIFIIFDSIDKTSNSTTPEEKKIAGYVLIKEYPNSRKLGHFETSTTGDFSKHPDYWKPIYENEVLKTEDGEYVFQNQNVLAVNKNSLSINNCQVSMIPQVFNKSDHVFFADIEKAQKYINYKKPIFSLFDLETIKFENESGFFNRRWAYVRQRLLDKLYKSKFGK